MLSRMELQAITGQLFIIDGESQGDTAVPGLLALSAPGKAVRGRERDKLFVHLTLTGPLAETNSLTRNLVQNISQQFYQTGGSITSALRKALNDTNQKLLKINLGGDTPRREGAITCAVLHNEELYVVQTGESLALVGHNFGVERLPPHPPERITPLGRSAGLDFRYYHQRLLTGDMLLLADPRIAYLPSHALAPALVDTEVEFGLTELQEIVGTDSARLLLVEFSDESPSRFPPPAKVAATSTLTNPQRELAGAAAASKPARQPVRVDGAPYSSQAELQEQNLDVGHTTRRAAAASALGLSRAAGWLADLLQSINPPGEDVEEESINWVWPALLAIIIPLIVAIVVSSVYVQRGRVRRLVEIRQEMVQSLAEANQAIDNPDVARQNYNRLLTLAEEADSLRPGDGNVEELRRDALLALDRLDDVTRLSARPFHTFDNNVGLTAVALRDGSGGGIYTLDGANDVVYSHDTDELYVNQSTLEPQPIIEAGQTVGAVVVGELIDIMWRPNGRNVGRDGLAQLSHIAESGALVTYYPNFADRGAAPLGLSSEWASPQAITQFTERLYVLDPGTATIWKYFPEGDGFNVNQEERTLDLGSDADLGQAVDIDIYSEDGSIIVAYRDGRLRYYDTRSGRVQWDEQSLLQNGLAAPLLQPSAVKLVGKGLNASIFVLDAGNGRIVQISRGGTVLAQYRAVDASGRDILTNGTDIAVAETPLRVFATVGNRLYIATQE